VNTPLRLSGALEEYSCNPFGECGLVGCRSAPMHRQEFLDERPRGKDKAKWAVRLSTCSDSLFAELTKSTGFLPAEALAK
jgi:hypothetical protein